MIEDLKSKAVLLWLVLAVITSANSIQAKEVNSKNQHLRLNQLQYIGTHNSYHIAPEQGVALAIAAAKALSAQQKHYIQKSLDTYRYTHPSLDDQLRLGIRKFEIDVVVDREGGKFSKPAIHQLMQKQGIALQHPFDRQRDLQKPGFKVIHVPDLDVRSNCNLFVDCLREIKNWSDANPGHFPINIQLEAKLPANSGRKMPYALAEVENFNADDWRALEAEIASVFPAEQLISPASIRVKGLSTRESVLQHGWPSLAEVAGKIMFSLDNGGATAAGYQEAVAAPSIFLSLDEQHPQAAWFRLNDSFDRDIDKLVAKGFMVRSRADASLSEAINNDPKRRDRAFSSGAHFIDTDFIFADKRWSDYVVRFKQRPYVRCNPLTVKTDCPL